MHNSRLNYTSVVLLITLFSAPITHSEVITSAVSGATTSMAISQIFSGLDDLIDKARDAGDYLTMRAAMEAKDTIQAWKEANSELINKAFSELNESQQRVFNNTRQLIERANTNVDDRLKTVQQVVDQANQIIVDIPLNDKTYITRFYPRVKPAEATSSMTLRINGVNLDKGDPSLKLTQGNAPRMMVGPTEVQYTVSEEAIPNQMLTLGIVPLTIKYTSPKDGFWNKLFGLRETVERQLPIITLPANIGKFSYTIETQKQKKEIQIWTSQPQRFEGSNKDVLNIAKPLSGWRWDWDQGIGAFSQVPGGGEAASCNGIKESNSTADGITHSAHVDKIKVFPSKYGDGWHDCAVKGPIYKLVAVTETLPTQHGELQWTSDLRLPIPPDTSSVALEVTTFDGRKRIFNDSGADKFFDIIRSSNELIIRPHQPTDL